MRSAARSAVTTQVFRVLADPTRRALFERLAREGELSVSTLTAAAGVSQPAVSQHLAALKAAGLVRDRRHGRISRYRVEPRGLLPLTHWLAIHAAFWRDKFDNLEALLNREEL